VTIGDRELVLFRNNAGAIGALDDRCPHRGMRLSRGRVSEGRLTCPYHGWSFCPAGDAASPVTPWLRLRVSALETAERYGLVWVREPGKTEDVPEHDEPGMRFVRCLTRIVRAPLASVMDNFTEVEHTGVSHWQFGYDPDRMSEILIETESDAETVRVRTDGPQRPLGLPARLGFGISQGMRLICEWETSLVPTRSVWRWRWQDPRTGAPVGRRFKAVAYFNPVSPHVTQLVTFYYWSAHSIDRIGFALAVRPFLRLATQYEVALDIALMEGLASDGAGIPPSGTANRLHRQRRVPEAHRAGAPASAAGRNRDPRRSLDL